MSGLMKRLRAGCVIDCETHRYGVVNELETSNLLNEAADEITRLVGVIRNCIDGEWSPTGLQESIGDLCEKCEDCGDIIHERGYCNGCDKVFCEDCVSWCSEDYDEADGEFFCCECAVPKAAADEADTNG